MRRKPDEEVRDYGKCHMSRKEQMAEIGKSAIYVVWYSLFFYRSFWAFVPLVVLGIYIYRTNCDARAEKDRYRLLLQFRDMIRSAAAAMQSGSSAENAFLWALEDMRRMHGKEAMICRELELLQRGLAVNRSLEELFADLGKRSKLEQIREFADVLSVAKISGGKMTEIIRIYAEQIHAGVCVREEIVTLTAGRKMEQKIMKIMPFAITVYIEYSNRGYFQMLYHNFSGICIMSVCLTVYLTACRISDRILDSVQKVWR